MVMHNTHQVTERMKQRVSDLSVAGIPKYLIAKIVGIDEDTLNKHYDYELSCAQAEAVERISNVVAIKAQEGCPKAMALYLKTQGAKFGWVEKQVVEQIDNKQIDDLKASIMELEKKHERDY